MITIISEAYKVDSDRSVQEINRNTAVISCIAFPMIQTGPRGSDNTTGIHHQYEHLDSQFLDSVSGIRKTADFYIDYIGLSFLVAYETIVEGNNWTGKQRHKIKVHYQNYSRDHFILQHAYETSQPSFS
jgi:hypothetical protein